MKIALITRHAITNYGSLLQAFATQKVIENLGCECEIIDYIRNDESYKNNEKTLLKHKPGWNNNFIKKVLYLSMRQPESIISGKKFEKERTQYLNLSKRYTTIKQLKEKKPKADIYMTGSDQVWGPMGNGSYDEAYLLSFTEENDKRIAYAASFGRANMDFEVSSYFKPWLKRYNHVTVREESAVEILKEMGIRSNIVLDPTLLLDYSFWEKYTKPTKKQHKDYVLVYQLHNDKRVGKYAQKIADTMNLPLIRVSSSFHQIIREGKFVWCPKIGQFLTYIKNAKYIVTDSFHGTAFAINFNVPFIEILPNNKTGTRNVNILKMLNLLDRILENDNDISLIYKSINYSEVNKTLSLKRKESITDLKKMLNL